MLLVAMRAGFSLIFIAKHSNLVMKSLHAPNQLLLAASILHITHATLIVYYALPCFEYYCIVKSPYC